MSDIALSGAYGQQDASVLSLKMQFQAEQQVAGLVAQASQQPLTASQPQPSLNSGGPKGTQVNILV